MSQVAPVKTITTKRIFMAAGYKAHDLEGMQAGQSINFGRVFGLVEKAKRRVSDLGPYIEFTGAFAALCYPKDGGENIKISSSTMMLPSSAEKSLLEACQPKDDADSKIGDLDLGATSIKFQFGVHATFDPASPRNYAWVLDGIEAGQTSTLIERAQTALFTEFAPEEDVTQIESDV